MSGKSVFEVISCITDNNTLVKKSDIENFNTQSQLIVNESQEALFYKEGQALDLFGPGRHALITEKLPLFSKFFKNFFDGKTPFPCQIFFINKVCVLDVLWGTPAPIVLEDPQYNLIVNVRSSGQCGIRVSDSRRFIVKVVGQLPEFDVESVRRAIKGMMMTSLQNLIASTIITERIGVLEIATKLEELSYAVRKKLNEKLDDYGLEAVRFDIGTIFTDDADLAKLRQAKEKRLEMMNDANLEAYRLETLSRARASARAMEGYTYQEEQKYEVLKTAAGNTATGGEFVGIGVGLGAGLGVAGEIRNQMGTAMNPSSGGKTCPQCGARAEASAKFCQECGSALAPAKKFCSECGTQCEGTAKFCSVCGNKF